MMDGSDVFPSAFQPLLATIGHEQSILLGISSIVILGILAQWLAWRVRTPAILLLLLAGIFVGPAWQATTNAKLLDPDLLLGDLLYPIISLSVAIILFEGGLTLNLADLQHSGSILWRLVTAGALVTWLISAAAAHWLLGMPWNLSVLLGAILIVTGPTVIGPLLRFVRPVGDVGALLKWEGIVIDPIGATLALLVFEVISVQGPFAHVIAMAVFKTLAFGSIIGLAGALLLVVMLRKFWVADQLQVPMTLMMVIAAYVGSNLGQAESGLLAVTVMGVTLANQRFVPVGHILEFKESLTVLLIGTLFVLLGSRLTDEQLQSIDWRTLLFVLILLVVARPLAVWVSTIGTKLPRNQRIFLAWMAPRGIVAASVSSIFALRLLEARIEGSEQLVPATFAVIMATVSVYGLTATFVARRLGLTRPGNRGFLIAGANPVARAVAAALVEAGQEVLLVDTNRDNIATARMEGLPTFQGNILSEQLLRKIDGTSIGRLLAITPNPEVNALAALHFARHFGRSQVFQPPLAVDPKVAERVKSDVSMELRGRLLFGASLSFDLLRSRLADGSIKRTQLKKEFPFEALVARYDGIVTPMFVIDADGEMYVSTAANPITPKPGQIVLALVPNAQKPEAALTAVSDAGKQ